MNVAPKKSLAQHFLTDLNLLGVMGRLADLAPEDVVLEIGPGTGTLTRYLADHVSVVHAVELDRSLESELARNLQDVSNVRVVFADAVRFDYATLDPAPRKLVANLPYNVATPIVAESMSGIPTLERWCVMVQREIADRFFASPRTKAYGAVSVLIQLQARRIGFHPVPPSAFRPRPRVESAIVAFERVGAPPSDSVRPVVDAAFAHRRKTLVNSVAHAGVAARERAEDGLAAIGRPPNSRAEELEPSEFVALAAALV